MRTTAVLTLLVICVVGPAGIAQRAAILRDVTTVQVDPTVIANPEKVKDEFAANLVEDSLRNALRDSNFEVGESPVRAHIVLEEFSSGSVAKRFVVGFGAGRSTVAGRLVFQDAAGRELANVSIRVRGNLLFSPYQGGNTQRKQATASFDQKLIEEIARLKPVGPRAPAPAATPVAVAPAVPSSAPAPAQVTPASSASAPTTPPRTTPVVAAPIPAPAEAKKPVAASSDPVAGRQALEAATRSEIAHDWPLALQQYEKARELDPSMSVVIDAAIARVKASFGSDGGDAFRRARQYDALGRVDEAIVWYERAIQGLPATDANRKIAEERLSALRAGR